MTPEQPSIPDPDKLDHQLEAPACGCMAERLDTFTPYATISSYHVRHCARHRAAIDLARDLVTWWETGTDRMLFDLMQRARTIADITEG